MGDVQYGTTLPIVGLDADDSTAMVTNLIFASLWMGALGWELLMSMPFDVRLVRQTDWRSIPSSIHSLAYYASRYTTLAFIVTYVAVNAQSVSSSTPGVCESRVSAAAAFFVISQCSILLVFVMRTIALWNLDKRATIPLILAWLGTLGINLTIPIKGRGVAMQHFCIWSIAGGWVGTSMIVMALSAFLCAGLTVFKLNRQGWKGLLQSMLPSTTRSIDAEDVSRVLVQRTTVFFIVMLISIIIADVVYFTVDFPLWKLIGVPAYLAISSSLAGRIFRRSWRMTRSAEYLRPPSYFPGAWPSTTDSQGKPSSTAADAFSNANKSYTNRSEEAFSFVEGQFRNLPPTMMHAGLQDKELQDHEAQAPLPSELPSFVTRRASEPGLTRVQDDDAITPAPLPQVVVNMSKSTTSYEDALQERSLGAFGISEVPAFMTKALRSNRGNGTTAFAITNAPIKGKKSCVVQQRPATEPSSGGGLSKTGGIRTLDQSSLSSDSPVLAIISRPTTASSNDGSIGKPTESSRWASPDTSSVHVMKSSSPRDDLVSAPYRTRLWLDSSAERARMEAAAVPSRLTDADSVYGGSQSSGSVVQSCGSARSPRSAGGASLSRRNYSNKRMILDSASEAGDKLVRKDTGRREKSGGSAVVIPSSIDEALTHGPSFNQAQPGPSRLSYLPSPAIVSSLQNDARTSRDKFDLDAIRRSMLIAAAEQDKFVGTAGRHASQKKVHSTIRPRTAPSKVQEEVEAIRTSESDQPDEVDLLNAFRDAVNEDIAGSATDDRPRTSRGGRLGGFGQYRVSQQGEQEENGPFDAQERKRGTIRRTASMYDERPKRSAADATVKPPFGHATSAIEDQYRRLHVLTERELERKHCPPEPSTQTFSAMPVLERIDSRDTEEA